MLSFFSSPRRALIVAHDLLMTAVAVVASFYIRFEAVGLEERLDTLFIFLPAFVVYAGVIYFLFHLYEAKWRFASLPDLMNIVRAVDGAGGVAAGLDYFLVAPNVFGQYFFGKITIALYWILQIVLLERLAHGVPLFPLYAHAAACAARRNPIRRWCSAAPPTPKCCCAASKAAPSTRSGRSAFCRRRRPIAGRAIRGIPVLGNFEMLDSVVNDLAQRGTTVTRVIFTPSALEPDAKPEATLMRARRLGLTVSRLPSLDDGGETAAAGAGQCRGSAAAAERQDRLRAAGKFPAGPRRSSSPAAAARSARKSATAWSPSAPRGC